MLLVTILKWAALTALAGYDAWRRRLPNWLVGVAAGTASFEAVLARGVELSIWGPQVVMAIAVLCVGWWLVCSGVVGAGDVKLLAGLTLSLTILDGLRLIWLMAFSGGVLALAVLAFWRLNGPASQRPTLPYGVAIVGGYAALSIG